jgi:hypothetical protein
MPFVVMIVGFALAAGTLFALSFARKALEGLTTLRVKPSPGSASSVKQNDPNRAPTESTRRARDGSEADALGGAENEGMHPGRG